MMTMASGASSADRAEQLQAVHARHPDVGQHDVDVLAADQLAGRDAVLGDEHVEAVALEQDAHPLAHRLLVVHDQDARDAARRGATGVCGWRAGVRSGLAHDDELEASSGVAVGRRVRGHGRGGKVTRNVVPRPGCDSTSTRAS